MIASTRRKHKSVARKFLCVLMVDAQMFGSRSQPLGTADQASLCKIDDEKRVCPWVTGRARAVIPAHPSAPARLRAGGTEWRRSFGYLFPGGPAHGSKTRQPGQARAREKEQVELRPRQEPSRRRQERRQPSRGLPPGRARLSWEHELPVQYSCPTPTGPRPVRGLRLIWPSRRLQMGMRNHLQRNMIFPITLLTTVNCLPCQRLIWW